MALLKNKFCLVVMKGINFMTTLLLTFADISAPLIMAKRLKTTKPMAEKYGSSENIVVTNCVFKTKSAGLKKNFMNFLKPTP